MAVCYDKLWKLLIDKKINKTQLCKKAKITTNAMAKLGRNEDVRVEVLTKICNVLNCTIDDILELNKEDDGEVEAGNANLDYAAIPNIEEIEVGE